MHLIIYFDTVIAVSFLELETTVAVGLLCSYRQ